MAPWLLTMPLLYLPYIERVQFEISVVDSFGLFFTRNLLETSASGFEMQDSSNFSFIIDIAPPPFQYSCQLSEIGVEKT